MRLVKIRETNKNQELITPFNFCDRWCERCPFEIKDGCSLYQKEIDGHLQMIVEGRDPDDLKEILSTINEKFDETAQLVDEFATQEGIDVWGDEEINDLNEKIKSQEELVDEHPLIELAKTYAGAASNFVSESMDQTLLTTSQNNLYEAVIWYQAIISSKISLILNNLEKGLSINSPIDEKALCEAVAQIDICLKAIKVSNSAYDELIKFKKEFSESIVDLKDLLDEIKFILDSILRQIDEDY